MSSELLDLSTKREAAPARGWRNRYRTTVTAHTPRGSLPPGEHWGANTWPSKEIAEAMALDKMYRVNSAEFMDHVTYLGAFPCEGESPP